jgi:hypothetical protein
MTLQKVFAPAITWLREELANLEQQASATRILIDAFVIRASATDSARARIMPAKAPPRERHRSSSATSITQKRAPAARQAATNTETAAEADGAKELAEIVAVLARSRRDIEAAVRSKDASRMKMAVTAIARAERRGGEILTELKGQSLPISLGRP